MRRKLVILLSLSLVVPLLAASPQPPSSPEVEAASGATGGVLDNFTTDGDGLVRLQVGAFDPLADPPPVQDGLQRLDASAVDQTAPAYWLVQVEGDAIAAAYGLIEEVGATVAGAVPERTYLVRATPEQRAAIDASPAVRWTGPYEPSYKVPVAANGKPGLLELDGSQTYKVYAFANDPEATRLADLLRRIDGVQVLDGPGPVVTVRATAAQVPDMAALTAVEWIGLRGEAVPLNRNARWVSDTGVRDLYGVTAPGRLTGAGQAAAIADTGVNYVPDVNGKAHAAFRDCPDYPDDCKLADYTQATSGSTVEALTDIVDNGTDHRKVAAYFDLGGGGVSPPDLTGHGTHVSGSVGADYGENGTWEEDGPGYRGNDGMAPGSRLVIQQIATATGGLGGLPADDYDLWRQAYRPRDPESVPKEYDPADYANYVPDEDARTHNNSYSLIAPIIDDASANRLDQFIWDHEDMLVVASAGNSGPSMGTVGTPSVAKNSMSSAASDNGRMPGSSIDTMAHFSSHGPTGDGRLGIDVATPGQIVVSAKGGAENNDHYLQGTSMSGPVLTGLATLVREYFYEGYGPAAGKGFAAGERDAAARRHNPSAALVRATIVNGATRMRGWYTGDEGTDRNQDGQYPSYGQGFGLANLDNSLHFDGDTRSNWYHDVWRADDEAFAPGVGATRTYEVDVAEGEPLDVTLVWTDAPGALPAGTPSITNNLDLAVSGPSGSFNGNNFNTETNPGADEYTSTAGLPDTVNTVERVRVAEPEAGTYTVTVRGTAVQQGPQGFALAASGNIAPVGETFSPGDPRQLDQAGAPAISDVEVEAYSADTAVVRFTTDEPTTAKVMADVGGETREFVDFYNAANDSWFTDYYQPGPVETSERYANRPVVDTEHEIFVYGTEAGQRYELTLTADDLGGNGSTVAASFTTPANIFQPLAPDSGNLAESDTDPVPSFLLGGSGWRTMTQFYVGEYLGSGYLGAFMFRLPEDVDPDAITGAAVEMTSSYEFASRYSPTEVLTMDLLDESVEPNWGTQNYSEIHNAPADARAFPETSIRRGGNYVHSFAFRCNEIDVLKDRLREADDDGNRNVPMRLDMADLEDENFIPGFESGFNRRSKGPHTRPRLVLFTDGGDTLPGGCDANTPAPVIGDVQVAPGVEQNEDGDPVLVDDQAVVYWETDEPSDSTVLFRRKGDTGWTQVRNPSLSTLHQVQVHGLDPSADYEFAVRSAACNGAASTDTNGGAGYAFFLDPGVPAEPPTDFEVHASYGFDSSLEGWEVENDGTATGPTGWRHEPAYGNPAGSAAVSPYVSQSTTTLTAPEPVTFGADGDHPVAQVRFDLDIDTEPTFDFLHLEYQQGDGPWRRAGSWEGFSGGFEEQVVDLDVDMGEPVLVRFVFDADFIIDSTQGFTGVWVDNVDLRTGTGGAPAEGADETHTVPPHPAPSAEGSVDLSGVTTRTDPADADRTAGTAADCAPLVTVDSATVLEGDDDAVPAAFALRLSQAMDDEVSVDWTTEDATAAAGEDYEQSSGTVTFAPGEQAKLVTVDVAPDRETEGDESFLVRLDAARGVAIGDRGVAAGVIRDDDTACPTLRLPDAGFRDALGNTHQDNIFCIAWYGITLGKGDTDGDGNPEYDPTSSVTRAQMASFVARTSLEAGLDLPEDPPDAFDDDDGFHHEPSINALAAVGLVEGVGGRRYEPHKPVRRDQMASFITRLHQRATSALPQDPPDAFDDDDGNFHEANINALAELGVVFGKAARRYDPRGTVTRGQMASFVARDLNLLARDKIAWQGGALVRVDAAAYAVAGGGDVTGTVGTNKALRSLTADGCGLEEQAVDVDGGAFSVTVPSGDGTCLLTFTATTERPSPTKGEPDRQTSAHAFTIAVAE